MNLRRIRFRRLSLNMNSFSKQVSKKVLNYLNNSEIY